MCERTCPKCGCADHIEQYGIIGLYIVCDQCGTVLASRRDLEAAPIDLNAADAEAWQRDGTFVLPGAEAKNPADDVIFGRPTTKGTKEAGR